MPKDIDQPVLTISLGQFSAAGKKASNQDFQGALIPKGAVLTLKGIALAIADGISTSTVSRAAAETAVKSLMTDYYATPDGWTVKTAASRVISATNSWLSAQNGRTGGDINHGMVCTLSALIFKGRQAYVFHVGDSRIARVSGESLEPLTADHRTVLAAGESYLGRAMGAKAQVEIDYACLDIRRGEVFVLTSDGVHDHVSAKDVARLIRENIDLDHAARAIADLALANGSDDNLTIQIARVETLPLLDTPNVLDGADILPIPALPRDGDVIDGFRVQRQIHGNARSHIYLALAPDGARVALKIPAVDLRENPKLLHRLMMEDWVARRVSSPHVLRAATAPEQRTGLYTVSEFVDGQTLRQWMTDNPKPTLDDLRRIISQIVAGLRAFHRREMLHQDLRPENILIDREGTVKIIDFGSVRVAGLEEAGPDEDEILGTYQYTAPEYLSGDAISWRSDLFALGVIAYEMLTGRLPYGTAVAKVRNRTDQRRLIYRTARDEKNGVPDWIDDALRRAVHPDPLRRQNALSEFAASLNAPSSDWRASQHVPLADRNPTRFWQSIALILAIICLILTAKLMT
ncbi:MAG: bifunctional protein-serine/threonine kinase/phosphatase [Deltaproteobacteria bacterium]